MHLRVFFPVVILITSEIVYSKDLARYGRENTIELCVNNPRIFERSKIQCFCKETAIGNTSLVFKADCTIDDVNIPDDDDVWRAFSKIKTIERLTLSSKSDKVLTYIPTLALKSLRYLLKLSIQHSSIPEVHSHAFANLTNIEEIKLSGNGISLLSINSFAHHPNLTIINLDNNNIEDIKRQVFRRMPHLQELFINSNNISIIHDRAFSHLDSLRTLELDKNSIFVLTSETFRGLNNLTRLELSHNNVEVIGDSTFAGLKNLRALNLAYNKIKVLDDRAFHGLIKLESLALDHNKIKQLSNSILFSGLPMLFVLNVKSNDMNLFTKETVHPILGNLYTLGSSLGFEDNKYPCDCHLNWFLEVKNKTKNTLLQEKLNNLMCYPDPTLAKEFKKYEEAEKAKDENRNDEVANDGADYDYYDEKSLDGKLFFSDIPSKLLPCPTYSTMEPVILVRVRTTTAEPTVTKPATLRTTMKQTTKVWTNPTIKTASTNTTPKPSPSQSNFNPEWFSSSVDTTETTRAHTLPTSSSSSSSTTTTRTKIVTIPTTSSPEVSELSVTTHIPFKTSTQEFLSETATTRHKLPKLNPTEEMVSDGDPIFTRTKSYAETTTETKINAIVSTDEPKFNESNHRSLIHDTRVNNLAETKAESMSHVHISHSVRVLSDGLLITLSFIIIFRL